MYSDRKQISTRLGIGAEKAGKGREERKIKKENEEIFKDEGYAHYLDCGNGFTDVYICQNLPIYNL